MKEISFALTLLILSLAYHSYAFVPINQLKVQFSIGTNSQQSSSVVNRKSVLYMGRAAAVRAATKAKTDSAKAKNNGRFAKKIIMAVKAGGADPEVNRNLAGVIADAKAAQVPKDIITRNIDKASAASAVDFKESLFEFYGHGGVGLLINVLTDNDNRASAGVNLVAKKNSLKPASMGSVFFNFDKKARLDVTGTLDEDYILEKCLEGGVDDFQLYTKCNGSPLAPKSEGKSVIIVPVNDMAPLRDLLRGAGHQLETSLCAVPKADFVTLSDEDFELNMTAIDAFEELDDVDSVEHNIDTSFEIE